MRKYLVLGISCVLGISVVARGASLAGGGDPFLLQFDENGNGSITFPSSAAMALPGVLAPDPTLRSGLVLTYFLPTALTGTVGDGDVRIFEPGGNTVLTDLLTFTDANGNLDGINADRMIYRSDISPTDGDPALADTGVILPFYSFADGGGVAELGAEGANGFDWRPDGAAFPGGNEYIGNSDSSSVPLPSSAWTGMALLGGLGLITVARQRRAMTAI